MQDRRRRRYWLWWWTFAPRRGEKLCFASSFIYIPFFPMRFPGTAVDPTTMLLHRQWKMDCHRGKEGDLQVDLVVIAGRETEFRRARSCKWWKSGGGCHSGRKISSASPDPPVFTLVVPQMPPQIYFFPSAPCSGVKCCSSQVLLRNNNRLAWKKKGQKCRNWGDGGKMLPWHLGGEGERGI